MEREVRLGIYAEVVKYPCIDTLSIETWGVDYMLFKNDESVLPVYAYRDSRTEAVIPKVHEKVTFSELYLESVRGENAVPHHGHGEHESDL